MFFGHNAKINEATHGCFVCGTPQLIVLIDSKVLVDALGVSLTEVAKAALDHPVPFGDAIV